MNKKLLVFVLFAFFAGSAVGQSPIERNFPPLQTQGVETVVSLRQWVGPATLLVLVSPVVVQGGVRYVMLGRVIPKVIDLAHGQATEFITGFPVQDSRVIPKVGRDGFRYVYSVHDGRPRWLKADAQGNGAQEIPLDVPAYDFEVDADGTI